MISITEFKTLFDKFSGDLYSQYNGEDAIHWSWSTGGASGGNCWDDSPATYSGSGETAPDTTPLDTFLMDNFTGLSFMQYKKIVSLVISGEASYNEYYGNYTDYAIRYITYDSLLSALTEFECVSSS